jgi:hypothetical protein
MKNFTVALALSLVLILSTVLLVTSVFHRKQTEIHNLKNQLAIKTKVMELVNAKNISTIDSMKTELLNIKERKQETQTVVKVAANYIKDGIIDYDNITNTTAAINRYNKRNNIPKLKIKFNGQIWSEMSATFKP